ncbi:MAG: DUF3579 domain-containing protein [Burkholderiales bacterium]|nr:DUF3579 domain-containing protein [Burkholderiales bacterium]
MDSHARASAPPEGLDSRGEIVIQGMTSAGRKFRPSDWAERLCGMMSVFGEDRHLSYSPYLKPVVAGGLTCVVVDRRLEQLDPAAFKFLLGFAHDNELCMRPGRDPKSDATSSGAQERRAPEPLPENSSS